MIQNPDEIRGFLKTIPDTKQVIAYEEVDPETEKAYKAYSDSFGRGELSENEIHQLAQVILESRQEEVKKKALTLLAHLGTISAFKKIEEYYNFPETPLKQWAALAMHECKTYLENDLTEHSIFNNPFNEGTGGKMRLYVLLLSPTDTEFSDAQLKIIKDAFETTAKELKCVIESVNPISKYNCASMLVLVSHNVAIDTLLSKGINRCNADGSFVFEHYYSGTGMVDESEIPDIIKKIWEG